MENDTKVTMNNTTITSNFIWRFLERFGAYLVAFIISIILARILDPEVYGTVAIITVFTTIFEVFVTSGFGSSLIQKKQVTELDFNTVLLFNIVLSLFMYGALFIAAPFIANFYSRPILTWLIRVSGITIVISSIKNIQYARVARNMQFKKFFFSTLGGTIFSGVIGIVMACLGFGPWALVISGVANHFIDTLILAFTAKWKPKLEFSFQLLKGHFKYGWKLLLSKLVTTAYGDIRQLAIGKKYTDSDLAFFNRGKTYPNMFVTNIANSINSVMFPVMSRKSDNVKEVNASITKSIKTSTYILFPMMIGLAMISEPFITVLLTEKWLPCVPYLRIYCFVYALIPIEIVFNSVIMASGKSGRFLIMDIIKATVGITTLLLVINLGVEAIAYTLIFNSIFDLTVSFIAVKRVTGYRFSAFFDSIFKNLVISLMMGVVVFSLQKIGLNSLLTMIIQVIIGIAIYVGLSIALNVESIYILKEVFIKLIKRRKQS